MKKVYVFTDGACSGNPGPGGWGAILRCDGVEKELCGGEKETTNNRMELTAVIKGLQCLKRRCAVTVVSDSKYVCDAINKNWLNSWKSNNWKKADKKPVLNPDLWTLLLEELDKHEVTFNWIKGHAGHPYNEKCDEIAVNEYKKLI